MSLGSEVEEQRGGYVTPVDVSVGDMRQSSAERRYLGTLD